MFLFSLCLSLCSLSLFFTPLPCTEQTPKNHSYLVDTNGSKQDVEKMDNGISYRGGMYVEVLGWVPKRENHSS